MTSVFLFCLGLYAVVHVILIVRLFDLAVRDGVIEGFAEGFNYGFAAGGPALLFVTLLHYFS